MKINENNPDFKQIRDLLESCIFKDPVKKNLLEKKPDLKEVIINREINKLNNSDIIYSINENGLGIISISEKPWESSIFNKKIAAIDSIYINDISLLNKLLDFAMDWINEKKIDQISYRTENILSNVEKTEKIRIELLRRGFHFVETYVTYSLDSMDFDKKIIMESNMSIKLLDKIKSGEENKTMEQIISIAEKSFGLDRFHIDHFFDNNLADKSRGEWIANIARGRGKVIYCIDNSGNVIGFLGFRDITIKNDTDSISYSIIELIAVDKNYQAKGIGSNLINQYHKLLKKNEISFSIVGTQAINISSIRLYEKCGYRIMSCSYTYHWNN